ncbi:TonB-dependent receptor [Aquabacterium sp.]|uniref:TonB-dependent receptor n=1 Tax=Aquabacterium sp. TaxID=1872578 RepID=UPI003782F934
MSFTNPRAPDRWRGRLPGVLLGLLAALAGSIAAAQTAPTSEPETVTVTANRREQAAQKVSGVVQSIDGDQLRKDGITELRQLQNAVPGLSIANQEGNLEIYIRGVGSANNTELGDPGAAPHLNGVYIPRPRGLGLMFFDLERVEVNKGPQGTLYGRNALGGTLNVITAKPRLGQFGGYAQAELSNRKGNGAEAALNVPLGERMALRAALYTSKKDYGFENATASALASGDLATTPFTQAAAQLDPAGLERNHAARLSYQWEISDKLRLNVVADHGTESGTGYPGANINPAVRETGQRAEDLDLRRVVYRGAQGELHNTLGGLQVKADYDLGPVTLEYGGSRRTVDFHQRNAASEGIGYAGRNYNGVEFDNFSTQYWVTKSTSTIHELRVVREEPKDRLSWAAGLFHFNEDQQVGYLSLQDRGYCCYSGTEFTMPKVNGKSSAGYLDGSFKLSDDWRAIGGLRYTTESKYRYGLGGNFALVLGGADYACCVATRFGTEGFVPALLSRGDFNVTGLSKQQQAQFFVNSILTPGARDTVIPQIGPIASGSNPQGGCATRPDIDNGFVKCPTDQNGGFSYANITIPGQQEGRSSAKYGDFRIGFEHDLNRDQMVYAKVSTGHKAGGFNDSFAGSAIPETFKPERLTVLELGSRNAFDWMGRRSTFNITGFYYDYKDQVFQDLACIAYDNTKNPPCTGYSLVNRNIGASRLFGLELESRLALPMGFRADVNAALLNTRITKGELADFRAQSFDDNEFGRGRTPTVSVVGNELPNASRVSLAVRLQQAFALGGGRFDWQVLVNYRSRYYLTPFNEKGVDFLDPAKPDQTAQQAGFPDAQKGYATVNLGLGYEQGGLRVELFAANVTDEQASQKAIVGNNLNIRFLNDARSYGLRGRYSF